MPGIMSEGSVAVSVPRCAAPQSRRSLHRGDVARRLVWTNEVSATHNVTQKQLGRREARRILPALPPGLSLDEPCH